MYRIFKYFSTNCTHTRFIFSTDREMWTFVWDKKKICDWLEDSQEEGCSSEGLSKKIGSRYNGQEDVIYHNG